MPIHSPWRSANADHVSLNVPHEAGVYELKSFGNLVYIGQADDLKDALLDHLDTRSPNYYRFETPELLESPDDLYDRHLHRYEREHGGLPAWNESEREAEKSREEDSEGAEPEADPDETADDDIEEPEELDDPDEPAAEDPDDEDDETAAESGGDEVTEGERDEDDEPDSNAGERGVDAAEPADESEDETE